jgi:ESCRT-I complex subunit VPS37
LQEELYKLRSETKDAFDEAKSLEARWAELQREQREVYQVRHGPWTLLLLTTIQRFTPQFLLMRLRHATTAQDDLSETLASSFVRSTSSETAATPANGKEVEDFVNEFRELRKTYHKRVMWGDRWTIGQVGWRDEVYVTR